MYLLDANTYIEAKNFHYNMNFCPAYWDWLDLQYGKGSLSSISGVYDELVNYGDELSDWVKSRKNHFLNISDDQTQNKFAEIAQFVAEEPNKKPEYVADFLSGADPWLIAKAVVLNATIVTHEVLVPDESTRIKIPNICRRFDIKCINTFQLLQSLKARFILDTSSEV